MQAREAQWERAEHIFRRAVGIAPRDPLWRYRFAFSLLLALRRIEEAIRELQSTEHFDPYARNTHFGLYVAFRAIGRFDEADSHCIPHTQMLRENNVRKGFVEHDTYLELLQILPIEIQPIFVAGYHTGARVGELKKIRWPQVDLLAKRIVLDPGTTKNEEPRTLPIYGDFAVWLKRLSAERRSQWPECEYVFHRNGKPVRNFRKSWAEACKRAGVPGLIFHDLRRTAVRNMVRAGIPEKVAMQISGHKTRSVFDRYNIVSDRDLTDAAERMEAHLQNLGTLLGTPQKKGRPRERAKIR